MTNNINQANNYRKLQDISHETFKSDQKLYLQISYKVLLEQRNIPSKLPKKKSFPYHQFAAINYVGSKNESL